MLGLTAQDFAGLFPDAVNQRTRMEVAGVCIGDVVVINGPMMEIQIIPGFDAYSRPSNQSGLVAMLPLVVEVDPESDCGSGLPLWLDTKEATGPRSISLVSYYSGGSPEAARWNFFEYIIDREEPGFEGRKRYVLVHTLPPANQVLIERDPRVFPSEISINPATDKKIEISGIGTPSYPAIEVADEANARLVLVYDSNESGVMYEWFEVIAEMSSFNFGKREISVITEAGGVEVSRHNYFGCFPVRWEQFGGFRDILQVKERLVVQCDFSEPA